MSAGLRHAHLCSHGRVLLGPEGLIATAGSQATDRGTLAQACKHCVCCRARLRGSYCVTASLARACPSALWHALCLLIPVQPLAHSPSGAKAEHGLHVVMEVDGRQLSPKHTLTRALSGRALRASARTSGLLYSLWVATRALGENHKRPVTGFESVRTSCGTIPTSNSILYTRDCLRAYTLHKPVCNRRRSIATCPTCVLHTAIDNGLYEARLHGQGQQER